jgi:2,3-bisphosphoglycerate-independent phosphoglycerate mutase
MVGHTGNLEATIRAIEAIDECLGHVLKALKHVGGELIITADHGNAEMMVNPETGQPHTAHTTNLVPLVYVGRPLELVSQGVLSDIAPTMLELMGLEQPMEMTGHTLIKKEPESAESKA